MSPEGWPPEWPDEEKYYDPSMPYACPDCEDGLRMICIDDLCRGSGECFYASMGKASREGCYAVCRTCKGSGEILDDEVGR